VAWIAAAFGVAHYGTSRYAAGRRSVMQAVQFDSALLTTTRRHAVEATARTDTVVRRVLVTRYRVDTLIQRVPDTLRVVPEIAELSGVTGQLLTQIDTLTHAIDLERAAARLRADVDSAALVSARGTIVQQDDAVRSLERRPTWGKAGAVAIGGAVLGFVAGVLR
jgi:hypothetical protein